MTTNWSMGLLDKAYMSNEIPFVHDFYYCREDLEVCGWGLSSLSSNWAKVVWV